MCGEGSRGTSHVGAARQRDLRRWSSQRQNRERKIAPTCGGDAFLATQGDVWDTQWDMFLAMCGAITAQWLLGHVHDRQLARVQVGLR